MSTIDSNRSKDDGKSKTESRQAYAPCPIKKENPTHLTDREANDSDQDADHAGQRQKFERMEGSMGIREEAIVCKAV